MRIPWVGFLSAFTIVFFKMAYFALPYPSRVVRSSSGLKVTNTLRIVMRSVWARIRSARGSAGRTRSSP